MLRHRVSGTKISLATRMSRYFLRRVIHWARPLKGPSSTGLPGGLMCRSARMAWLRHNVQSPRTSVSVEDEHDALEQHGAEPPSRPSSLTWWARHSRSVRFQSRFGRRRSSTGCSFSEAASTIRIQSHRDPRSVSASLASWIGRIRAQRRRVGSQGHTTPPSGERQSEPVPRWTRERAQATLIRRAEDIA
jgi:hypothetical protein